MFNPLSWFKNPLLVQKPFGKIHNYTDSFWGHSLTSQSRVEKYKDHFVETALGWGPLVGSKIKLNDLLLVKMQSGKTAAMQVKKIEYKSNPRDMFSVTMLGLGYWKDGVIVDD